MRLNGAYLRGSALPAAVAASIVLTVGMLGLLMLWERERMAELCGRRQRQAEADVRSALALYRLYPTNERILSPEGYTLYDTLPRSMVRIRRENWGLYETVYIVSCDSLARLCVIAGAAPDSDLALWYADSRAALNIAGSTRLRGIASLPQNGAVYGRVGQDCYDGEPIPDNRIRQSSPLLPAPDTVAEARLRELFARRPSKEPVRKNCHNPFSGNTTLYFHSNGEIAADCRLSGHIVVTGERIRIDSQARLDNIIICARTVTVAAGARIAVQIIASDTVVVEPRAAMLYPSGLYAGHHVQLDEDATIDGYVIVRDTVRRERPSASYRQAPTARLRGLLYVEGTAEVRGYVTGCAYLRSAAYFSEEGYYKDMLYDARLRPNPLTAHPLWIAGAHSRRKEAVCVD